MQSNHPSAIFIVLNFFFILFFSVSCSSAMGLENEQDQLRVHDLQGCTHLSPFDGKSVNNIPGIVTAKEAKGFYLQDDQPDTSDCSSEAIFVFTDAFSNVLPGDRVLVSGKVMEFVPGKEEDRNLTITEITQPEIQIISHGNALPDAVKIGENGRQIPNRVVEDDSFSQFDTQNDGLDFYESLESMLVAIDAGIVVGPRNSYNEVVVIPPGSLNGNLISAEGGLLQQEADFNPERIILNLNESNIEAVNAGARLLNPVEGIVDYSYGNYKINTFGRVEFSDSQTKVADFQTDEVALSLASFNAENLSQFDGDAKFRKIANIIVKRLGSPDLVLLHEVMDDSGVEDNGVVTAEDTIQKVISAIQTVKGPSYSFTQLNPVDGEDGGIAGGNIRSVILYRTDTGLELVNENISNPMRENPQRIGTASSCFTGARKPVAALFERNGKRVLVIGAHLTSRGMDSPVFGSLQPVVKPEEKKRICQAEYIRKYIEDFAISNPHMRVILAGDMNDDPWSAVLQTLTSTGLTDLSTLISPNERFTYILDGNAIQLDYILTNNAADHGDRFMIPHINSIFDHTLQTSDHDPVLALINLE